MMSGANGLFISGRAGDIGDAAIPRNFRDSVLTAGGFQRSIFQEYIDRAEQS
jgi:hypothetical protein